MIQATILSLGRWKEPALREIFQLYAKRCRPALQMLELELPARDLPKDKSTDLKAKEAALLFKHWPTNGAVIVCDEHAPSLPSRAFAEQLAQLQAQHGPHLTFIIGGADGLAPEVLARAHLRLGFGAQTWPHLLVRVLLAEQLYRAGTILSGHPYHRD